MQPFVAKVLGIRNGRQLTCVRQKFNAGINGFDDDPREDKYTVDVYNLKEDSDLTCGRLILVHPILKTFTLEQIQAGEHMVEPYFLVCSA